MSPQSNFSLQVTQPNILLSFITNQIQQQESPNFPLNIAP